MDDYISRQATIEALKNAITSLSTPDGTGAYDVEIQAAAEAFVDAIQIVNGIKSSDISTVVRGRWRWVGQDQWNDYYECSQCGKMNTDNSNFCPNCGAMMMEE